MPRKTRVALVTGATKGIGYAIGKELLRRIPSLTCFMTSSGRINGVDPDFQKALLGMELGAGARERGKFITMDIREQKVVVQKKEEILREHKGLDILINNAGIYEKPETDPDAFSEQAKRIIATNYWGTKNVMRAFHESYVDGARIVNITSNLAHVKSQGTAEHEDLKIRARARFAKVETFSALDGEIMSFLRDAELGLTKKEGWPVCAYTISKMALNRYTRILQTEFEGENFPVQDVVVNAVYPQIPHSKIQDDNIKYITTEDAAKFILYIATMMPSGHHTKNVFPRGDVIWDNTMVICDKKASATVGYTRVTEDSRQRTKML